MLSIGLGRLDAAAALAGEPLYIEVPEIFNIVLLEELTRGVTAKFIILFHRYKDFGMWMLFMCMNWPNSGTRYD